MLLSCSHLYYFARFHAEAQIQLDACKKCILAKSPAEEAFSFVRVKCTSLSLHNSQSVNFCEDLSSTEAVVTMGASLIKHILFC